jgi:hypothetical protein
MHKLICDHDLILTNVVARWPGSTHDSRNFENSNMCARLERKEIPGILIGDNEYPLRPYLITPLLTCTTWEQRHFNYALCNARVKIEQRSLTQLKSLWKNLKARKNRR